MLFQNQKRNETLLWTEWHPSPKFLGWSCNPQCEWIWTCGLQETLRLSKVIGLVPDLVGLVAL